MSIRITEAVIKPVLTTTELSRNQIISNRFHYLTEAVVEANVAMSVYFVIRGEVPDFLNLSGSEFKRLAKILDSFRGAAVLIVADLHSLTISKINKYFSGNVLHFPDDKNKNLSIRDMIGMIEHLCKN